MDFMEKKMLLEEYKMQLEEHRKKHPQFCLCREYRRLTEYMDDLLGDMDDDIQVMKEDDANG